MALRRPFERPMCVFRPKLMQIDLAKVLTDRRKGTVIRNVQLPRVLELQGYNVFKAPVDFWARSIEGLVAKYRGGLAFLTDDIPSDLIAEIDQIGDAALAVAVSAPVADWVDDVAARHEQRFISAVRAATKFDVGAFLSEHVDDIGTYREWGASLIKDLTEETRRKVSAKVLDGIANRTHPEELQRELRTIIGSSRKRARLIASDQANKLHAKMQELRAQEVGIREYIWRTAGDERVRMTHATANGKRFSWEKPPSEIGRHPGEPIRCRCSAQAYIPLLEEI